MSNVSTLSVQYETILRSLDGPGRMLQIYKLASYNVISYVEFSLMIQLHSSMKMAEDAATITN